MTYVQYCSKCERKTEHVRIQIEVPVEYRTHGRITDTIGWLGCRECRKQQVYGKAEGRQG
jgi:hypothetical protein